MQQIGRTLAIGMLFAAVVAARPSLAKFAFSGQPVPVERLLANVGRYVDQNPKDAQGHYILGRIHSLAFVRSTEALRVSGNPDNPDILPGFPPYESVQTPRENAQQAPTRGELRHLASSIKSYQAATELAPKKSLYWLGLGWMLEQGMPYAAQVPAPFMKEPAIVPAEKWRVQALDAYRQAYALDVEGDTKRGGIAPGADTAISLEAGEGILRLLQKQKLTSPEKLEIVRVTKTVEQLKSLPRAVTPLVFPLNGPAPLASLLSGGPAVTFDLAADTRGERWPWVNASAGILVWDPARSGKITSGAQLFGTVTWSMYWSDGYAPLAALDDDRNGWLEGAELDGLAVWNDRNGNAKSDPGEVKPLSAYQVKRLAVRSAGRIGRSPFHPHGIERNDGTTLPTYDWIPTSLPTLSRTR